MCTGLAVSTASPTEAFLEHLRVAIQDEAESHGLTLEEAQIAILNDNLEVVSSMLEVRKPVEGETIVYTGCGGAVISPASSYDVDYPRIVVKG